jgi:hypothetical protein
MEAVQQWLVHFFFIGILVSIPLRHHSPNRFLVMKQTIKDTGCGRKAE